MTLISQHDGTPTRKMQAVAWAGLASVAVLYFIAKYLPGLVPNMHDALLVLVASLITAIVMFTAGYVTKSRSTE